MNIFAPKHKTEADYRIIDYVMPQNLENDIIIISTIFNVKFGKGETLVGKANLVNYNLDEPIITCDVIHKSKKEARINHNKLYRKIKGDINGSCRN